MNAYSYIYVKVIFWTLNRKSTETNEHGFWRKEFWNSERKAKSCTWTRSSHKTTHEWKGAKKPGWPYWEKAGKIFTSHVQISKLITKMITYRQIWFDNRESTKRTNFEHGFWRKKIEFLTRDSAEKLEMHGSHQGETQHMNESGLIGQGRLTIANQFNQGGQGGCRKGETRKRCGEGGR